MTTLKLLTRPTSHVSTNATRRPATGRTKVATRRRTGVKEDALAALPVAPVDGPEEFEAERTASATLVKLQSRDHGSWALPQASATPSAPEPSRAVAPGAAVLPGGRLSPLVRVPLERAMRRDFSQVRVHTDVEARRLTDGLGAEAVTHRQDIYFGAGRFRPDTASGVHLLAHELTHTSPSTARRGELHARRSSGRKGPSGIGEMRLETDRELVGRNRFLAKLGALTERGEPTPHEDNPHGLSFELIGGRLIAKVVGPEDLDGLATMAATFAALSDSVDGEPPPRFDAADVPIPGTFDMTKFLPASLQRFMALHQKYLRHAAEFEALNRAREESAPRQKKMSGSEWTKDLNAHIVDREAHALAVAGRAEALRRMEELQQRASIAPPKSRTKGVVVDEETMKQYDDLRMQAALARKAAADPSLEPYKKAAGDRRSEMQATWSSVCHDFTVLLFGEASRLTAGSDVYSVIDSLRRSPNATRSSSAARVGDLAIFIATSGPQARADFGIVHSALVIRASSEDLADIEVLEKRDPRHPMSTRTIAQIQHSLKEVSPQVYFVKHPRL